MKTDVVIVGSGPAGIFTAYELLERGGRQNIVLTRDPAWTAEGVQVVHSAGELECLELMDPEIMVIGGAEIFSLMMPSMSRMWVSKVKGEYPADTFLPPFENRLERAVLKEHFEDFDLYLYEQVN